jgi:glycosyltransferase involved in cell wall biosynthesis
VSVIMPTRNRADLTIQAASSVLKQSYRTLELIIVDDGSNDGSDKRVEEWIGSVQVRDVQVKMLRQDQKGAPAARNLGAASSQGEFIQFMDSDDQLHPNKIALQKAVFDRYPQCDFVWSSHLYHRAEDGQQSFKDYTQVDPLALCEHRPKVDLFSTTGNVWSGLFRRAALSRVGPWNESLRRWQDVEYQVRFTALHPDCAFLPLDLYSMGFHGKERIRGLYADASGVEAGLHTLDEIHRFTKGMRRGDVTNAFRVCMGNFYLELAETAFVNGRTRSAAKCLWLGGLRGGRPGQAVKCLLGAFGAIVRPGAVKAGLHKRRSKIPVIHFPE